MPNADDTLLLMGTTGLALPQIVEIQIKQPTDGDYVLGLADFDPIVFGAAASSITEIRDGLADPIVSPAFAPLARKKIALDRFQVKGAPGDPFDAYLLPPDADAAKLVTIQEASGAPTTVRLWYLELASKLILESFWGDLAQYMQVLLTGYFLEAYLLAAAAASDIAAGGVASSIALGPASLGLSGSGVMPSANALESSTTYGQPLLLLLRSRIGGPIWSK